MQAVYDAISRTHAIPSETLEREYRRILEEETHDAFVDGGTSTYYRGRRLARLLEAFGIEATPRRVARLTAVYKRALLNALEATRGAKRVLRTLRSRGYSIAVISEGPADAQQWTIERLGLAPLVDLLVTSAQERTTKVDALFERALARMSHPFRPLFVGDSLQRDIVPAAKAGFRPVLYDPKHLLKATQSQPVIRTMPELLQYVD